MIKIYEMFENISNYHNKENFYEIAFYSHELKKSNHTYLFKKNMFELSVHFLQVTGFDKSFHVKNCTIQVYNKDLFEF